MHIPSNLYKWIENKSTWTSPKALSVLVLKPYKFLLNPPKKRIMQVSDEVALVHIKKWGYTD